MFFLKSEKNGKYVFSNSRFNRHATHNNRKETSRNFVARIKLSPSKFSQASAHSTWCFCARAAKCSHKKNNRQNYFSNGNNARVFQDLELEFNVRVRH